MDDRTGGGSGGPGGKGIDGFGEKEIEKLDNALTVCLAMSRAIYTTAVKVGFSETQAMLLASSYFGNSFKI